MLNIETKRTVHQGYHISACIYIFMSYRYEVVSSSFYAYGCSAENSKNLFIVPYRYQHISTKYHMLQRYMAPCFSCLCLAFFGLVTLPSTVLDRLEFSAFVKYFVQNLMSLTKQSCCQLFTLVSRVPLQYLLS